MIAQHVIPSYYVGTNCIIKVFDSEKKAYSRSVVAAEKGKIGICCKTNGIYVCRISINDLR